MKQKNQCNLPTEALYRKNCHDSDQSYFAYLCSTTEIKVLEFDKTNQIESSYSLTIPLEPVRGIKLLVANNSKSDEQCVYVCVAMVSRFMIFCNMKLYYEKNLQLDCNIVNFANGCISPGKFSLSPQRYGFIVAQCTGQVTVFNIPNMNSALKFPEQTVSNCTAIAISSSDIYLGDEKGKVSVYCINQNSEHYKLMGVCDTKSEMPILDIIAMTKKQQIVFTTCFGEIVIAKGDLSAFSVISAHHSVISRILYNPDSQELVTSGEDGWVHIFELEQQSKLKLKSSNHYSKIVNLVFRINTLRNMICFYENSRLINL